MGGCIVQILCNETNTVHLLSHAISPFLLVLCQFPATFYNFGTTMKIKKIKKDISK